MLNIKVNPFKLASDLLGVIQDNDDDLRFTVRFARETTARNYAIAVDSATDSIGAPMSAERDGKSVFVSIATTN